MFGVPPDFLIEAKNGLKYFTLNSVSSIAKISPNSSLGEQALTSSGSSGSDAAVAIATATVGGGVVVGAGAASPLLDTTPLPTKYSKYRLKTPEEYAAATNSAVPVLKKYLRYSRLDEVIMKCPVANRGKMTNEQKANEMMKRKCFLDFLKGLFNLNPFERWTAKQAAGHPFITNAPYIGRYVPEADRRAEERLTDFTRQMERLKLSQSIANSAVVTSSPIRNLSRSKVPSNFETIPREGEDAHRHVDIPDAGETAFTLLKNRRQTEPVELNSSKVRGKDEQGRPQLRRGNPVHMKQSGGSTESTFRSQPQSLQQQQQQQQQGQQYQQGWQRDELTPSQSHENQNQWQLQQHMLLAQQHPQQLPIPMQTQPQYGYVVDGGVGISPSLHPNQLVPNPAPYMAGQMPVYPTNQFPLYGSPQTWVNQSQYPNGYQPQMVPTGASDYVPIHAHPQVMYSSQFPVPNSAESYYLNSPSNFSMVHSNIPNSGYVSMGNSLNSGMLYGTTTSTGMLDGSTMMMTDFGLAMLRPEVNEVRMLHSQTYFIQQQQQQQQQQMIQQQQYHQQQQQQQHSYSIGMADGNSPGGNMGGYSPYGSMGNAFPRHPQQQTGSYPNGTFNNPRQPQHSRSRASSIHNNSNNNVNAPGSFERRARGNSFTISDSNSLPKRKGAPPFQEYQMMLQGSGSGEGDVSHRRSRGNSVDADFKQGHAQSCPNSVSSSATQRILVPNDHVNSKEIDKPKMAFSVDRSSNKAVVARTELDHSNSTNSSERTHVQDEYGISDVANSENTSFQMYNTNKNLPKGMKIEKEMKDSVKQQQYPQQGQGLRRNRSTDSLTNVEATSEAIADWDPFFSADDISHDDGQSYQQDEEE